MDKLHVWVEHDQQGLSVISVCHGEGWVLSIAEISTSQHRAAAQASQEDSESGHHLSTWCILWHPTAAPSSQHYGWSDYIPASPLLKFTESPRLEKTSKIIPSTHHQYSPTKTHPSVQHLYPSSTQLIPLYKSCCQFLYSHALLSPTARCYFITRIAEQLQDKCTFLLFKTACRHFSLTMVKHTSRSWPWCLAILQH